MLPFDQPVRLCHVEFFFVLAGFQSAIAAVLIADNQRLQVVRQVAAQGFRVRPPDRVYDPTQFLRGKGAAI